MHFNQMLKLVNTPYISIWDADIIPDKKVIAECIERLRSQYADIAYPYNGICYDIPELIKPLYLKKMDIRLLYRHINKMERLYPHALVGGAVMMNRERYKYAGGESERHYGWGNDDFDRYYRFIGLQYKIYRENVPLFHFSHKRGVNSQFSTPMSSQISSNERSKIENSSKEEILKLCEIPEAEKVIE